MLNIRDAESNEIDRDYVRNKAGGISKYLIGIVKKHMDAVSVECEIAEPNSDSSEIWLDTLKARNAEFLQVAKSWLMQEEGNKANIDDDSEPNQSWRTDYFEGRTCPSGWMGALHASGHWFDSRWGNYLTKFSPD